MSLILDALRKSEAERRRGQSPDIFASLPTTAPQGPPPWLRAAPGLALVGALVLALLGWFFWPSNQQEPGAAGPFAESVNPSSGRAGDGLASVEPPLARQPSGDPAEARPASDDLDATSPRPFGTAPNPSAAPPAIATPAIAAGPVVKTPEPQPPSAPVASPPPESPVAIAPAAALAPAELPPPVDDDIALPTLAVLGASERSALPSLKLSMHVWNSEPAKRFAIIDGQRLAEGAMVSGRVLVEEIRRDGVVLNLDGKRLLLPRP